MPEKIWSYWGKAQQGQSDAPHHLFPYHCLDVAAVAALWWERSLSLRKVFATSCGATEPIVRAWMLFFVALHDLGKLDIRFQLKASEVAVGLDPLFEEANPFESKGFDHGAAGYAWFEKERAAYGFSFSDSLYAWMKAVAGHHGRTPKRQDQNPPNEASDEVINHNRQARIEWVQELTQLFLTPAGITAADVPPRIPELLAGFCCVCDWVGSNHEIFIYVPEPTYSLSDYFDSRLNTSEFAPKALEDSGLWRKPTQICGMENLFPDKTPRGVQKIVGSLPVVQGLTLIEASTGSGKTEAALAYASRLLAGGFVDTIIFALPTQATANAMLARLDKAAVSLFPDVPNIVLAHGKARFNHRFQNLKRAARGFTVQSTEEAYAQCSQWLAQSRKRVFLGQIGVCTVDQVLLSVLPVKHGFVRTFGIGKSVLIVDEVHAYDSYMNVLLDLVLNQQQLAGGSAILLSATLPNARRCELLKKWGAAQSDSVTDVPYPLITTISGRKANLWKTDEPEESKIVTLSIAKVHGNEFPSERLPILQAKIHQGAQVAIICNLVADAQQVARQLESVGIQVDLFHSRYRFCDRGRIEEEVVNRFGPNGSRSTGRVLVATQVIEQSLDLDFDWMLTFVCPVELLFQRLGRLWRHKIIIRKGVSQPECVVLTPESGNYGLHALIYGDARDLWRTEQLITAQPTITFPAAYRDWIEKAATDEPWPDEPQPIIDAHERYVREELGSRYAALQIALSDVNPFADTEGKAGVLTREGELSLKVVPVLAGTKNQTLLDGSTILDELDDFERDKALDQHTIPVPHSWAKFLPAAQDDIIFLPFSYNGNDNWIGATSSPAFRYSTFFGLEKIDV